MKNTNGYVRYFRNIFNWGWYRDVKTFKLFFHFVTFANFADSRFQGVLIRRGQMARSLDSLAKETGLSVQSVRTAIDHLLSTGEITKRRYPNFTVFTVKNYEKYQDATSEPTDEQQAKSITKVLNDAETAKTAATKTAIASTSKTEATRLAPQGFEQIDGDFPTDKTTNKMPNEQQTSNKQTTKDQQRIKKNKEYQERKEKKNTRARVREGSPFGGATASQLEILSTVENEILHEAYLDYIEMRKFIKAPMTDRALTLLMDKVNKLEPDNIENQIQLIRTAIVNNWKSVYPLRSSDRIQNGNSATNTYTNPSVYANASWEDAL